VRGRVYDDVVTILPFPFMPRLFDTLRADHRLDNEAFFWNNQTKIDVGHNDNSYQRRRLAFFKFPCISFILDSFSNFISTFPITYQNWPFAVTTPQIPIMRRPSIFLCHTTSDFSPYSSTILNTALPSIHTPPESSPPSAANTAPS
jgi:hypothetical protein